MSDFRRWIEVVSRCKMVESKIFPLVGNTRHWSFDTTVIADPRPSSIKAFMKRMHTDQLRGTAADGQVYLWPAHDATHIAIRTVMGLSGGADFWIVLQDVEPLSPDWSTHDDNPVRDGLRLLPGRYGTNEPALSPIVKWFGRGSA